MNITMPIICGYLLVTVALVRLDVSYINAHPEQAPGGGRKAIAIRCALWPLILLAVVIMLPFWLLDAAISAVLRR